MLELREYQRRSLEALESYFGLVSKHGAQAAFVLQTGRPYRTPPELPSLPYVCLRIPTGGGKTLMACHALGVAARRYLQQERAVCLWLVPSNAIREQTLAALQKREHPYRQVIDDQFGGNVRVLDLTRALYVPRADLEGTTCIIVSTIQALRVEDTEGRKVYESSGALQHHFTGLSPALADILERHPDDTPSYSLANVLRLWRPVIIMDEAHNARKPLSFVTLARFNPSCVIEFTATPETSHDPDRELFASNVLHHVSAAELKLEEMLKLPVKLRTQGGWKEIVGEALQTQRSLERIAEEERAQTGEYIRPIVLFQAQPRSQDRQTLTVDVVKQTLIEDFKIPEEQIAIATGQTREIDDVNLLAPTTPIRFIITVQALREGWDCPFAYILCSVAEISSPRAVEQVLGRVLRMPRARRKKRAELNCAYVYAASPRFVETLKNLQDALIENGFQRMEAKDLVKPLNETVSLFEAGTLFFEAAQTVTDSPDLTQLEPAIRERVSYDEHTGQLSVTGVITKQEMEVLKNCFAKSEDRSAVERIFHISRGHTIAQPATSEQPEHFSIPLLGIRVGGQLDLFDESHFLEAPWNLAECDAGLSEAEFPTRYAVGAAGEVDVSDAGKVEMRQFVEQLHAQLNLLSVEPGWTAASLANWIDRQIPHPDIPQAQSSLFIHNAITRLLETRGLELDHLARHKFRLRNAVEVKIKGYRQAQAKRAYDAALFGDDSGGIEVRPELCFNFDKERYAPNSYYEGMPLNKHFFSVIGDLDSQGEEFECAVFINNLPQVKYWIRNLVRKEHASFWLPTSSDKFYPDFVAKLNDGRYLVVEYKNARDWSNDDSREKRAVGELWADRSGGRCLFIMPRGRDWSAIRALMT